MIGSADTVTAILVTAPPSPVQLAIVALVLVAVAAAVRHWRRRKK